MPGYREFLKYDNFDLAFTRIMRGTNRDYKIRFKHLLASYAPSLRDNLNDLIASFKNNSYRPEKPTLIYQPKTSGLLRPLTLLSIRDQIVYQALVNIVAESFEGIQQQHAFRRSFGAIYAGKSSPFFYRSWKKGYQKYNEAITRVFKRGNQYVADFDLASFYELVDHGSLRAIIRRHCKDDRLLELLFQCLRAWTADRAGTLGHGVPQGPEASAFLAECLLFRFDEMKFRDAAYVRYIDDIKLLAKSDIPLRRALVLLDLESKKLGLVPQAMKVAPPHRAKTLSAILKTLPSSFALASARSRRLRQKDLVKAFRRSLGRCGRSAVITDVTKFKFTLARLNPRRDILRRVRGFLTTRPDLSPLLGAYLRKFGPDREVADILSAALKLNPAYDSAAFSYISALDVCEPPKRNTTYRRIVSTARRRSVEKSILIAIAMGIFRGNRSSPTAAACGIESERNPLVQSTLVHHLFGDRLNAPFDPQALRRFLMRG